MWTDPRTASSLAPIFEPLTDTQLQIAAPRADDRGLDLACGTGIVSRRCIAADVASRFSLWRVRTASREYDRRDEAGLADDFWIGTTLDRPETGQPRFLSPYSGWRLRRQRRPCI